MNHLLTQLKYAFLAVFAVACAAVWIYQIGWVIPQQRCEAAHRWWSPRDRECAVPVALSTLTGRPNPAAGAAPAPSSPAPSTPVR